MDERRRDVVAVVVVAIFVATTRVRCVVEEEDDHGTAAAAAAAAVFRARARARMATQSKEPSSRVKGKSVVVPNEDEKMIAAVSVTAADNVAETAVASIGAFVCNGDA